MKKFIRDMINDLRRKNKRDFIPPVPKASTSGPKTDLNASPLPTVPTDLENQELSNDPLERIKQLDFEAHVDEVRETS
jgi:hypothetical protein